MIMMKMSINGQSEQKFEVAGVQVSSGVDWLSNTTEQPSLMEKEKKTTSKKAT